MLSGVQKQVVLSSTDPTAKYRLRAISPATSMDDPPRYSIKLELIQ
jgi:hypothetical protein